MRSLINAQHEPSRSGWIFCPRWGV